MTEKGDDNSQRSGRPAWQGKGTGRAEGKGLEANKQDRDESTTDICTQVRKRSLGQVVNLQGSSPPTSRTAKLVYLNSLENCIYGNLDQGNPKHGYRQGNEWIESNSVEKDLRVLVDKTLSKSHQCVLAAQKSNHIQLRLKKCDQQLTRGESPSLLW